MKIIYKKVGETNKEALDNFRNSNPEYKDEIMSYIGRLDPMAEGKLLIIIGKEENQKRDSFLGFNKEYEAEFLIGFKTDSMDVLGLLEEVDFLDMDFNSALDFFNSKKQEMDFLKKIKKQKFPWFSSKRVFGKALFDWYKNYDYKDIVRPEKEITIKEVGNYEFIQFRKFEIFKQIFEKINLVKGDFRQKDIIESWNNVKNRDDLPENFYLIKMKLIVSTGTYIRGLTQDLEKIFNKPVVLFSLKRTEIFLDNNL